MGPKRKSSDPHFDAIFIQVGFQVGNREQLLVEDARRKARVDAFVVEQLQKILLFARAAAGDDGHMNPRRHSVQQLEVETVPHAAGVDAAQADLPRAVLGAPRDPVQRIAAGVLPPAFGKDPEPAVHPLDVRREDDALVAVALGRRRDEVRVLESAGVDADLVGPTLAHPD